MRRHYKLLIFVLLLFLSIGFAYLTANLDVTGTIAFRENTWDVHLDNIVVEEDSLDADTPTINTDRDTVNFNISFTRPGDYYEFYVDVVNSGTMDASLDSTVKSTLTGNYLTNLDYNVTYYSDRTISQGDLLRAGCKERIKVRVEYKYDVDTYTKLDDINLFFKVNYIKTDTHASTYNAKVWNFDSKGEEDTFIVPKTGKYKLEVWGAQGGYENEYVVGGYGGYSVGNINLNKDDNVGINVGSNGICSHAYEPGVKGGYNGGGAALARTNYATQIMCSGGGATHIASTSGLLSSLSNNISNIIIVAAGGGGSGYWSTGYKASGGSGGGYIGCSSIGGSTISTGGTQTTPGRGRFGNGTFGQGAGSSTAYSCGGGGGYYGGGADNYEWGAAGGSSYIGNTNLTDKIMYCYNCQESTEEADETHIKTRSTTNVSETPRSNYAKIGHGYARITYVGN